MSEKKSFFSANKKLILMGAGLVLLAAVLIFGIIYLLDTDTVEPGEEADGDTKPADYIISETDEVEGKAVVATTNVEATRAALDVLDDGGNAFDAIVTAALVLGVVEPFTSGIGGDGVAVYYNAQKDEFGHISFRGICPREPNVEMYRENPELLRSGMTSGYVPRAIEGYAAILDELGTKDFSELVQPAIHFAREGYPVCEFLATRLFDLLPAYTWDPETSDIYTDEGFPLLEGDILTNEDLATTLETLAEEGPESFYTGSLAEKIVAGMQAGGSPITLEDFADKAVFWSEPLRIPYRDYEIYSADFPSGSIGTLHILNTLENFDFSRMDHMSPDRYHILAEANKQAQRDRYEYNGDPDFLPDGRDLVQALLSKNYAEAFFGSINMEQASDNQTFVERDELEQYIGDYEAQLSAAYAAELYAGDPGNHNTIYSGAFFEGDGDATANLVAADAEGNLIVITQSIGPFWGSGQVVPGTGILLNRSFTDFSTNPEHPNYMEPGKVCRHSRTPTIVAKDGMPVIGVGTPGAARIPSSVAQAIHNFIDYGMSCKEAIDSPKMFANRGYDFEVEGRICPDVAEELRNRGHEVKLYTDRDVYFGGITAVKFDYDRGAISGFADLRRGGAAGALALD